MTAADGGIASAPRKVTEVAVGVLLRADDAVLLADRPAGKPYAGYWEFPGGKIEPGESIEHALKRELHEELGIDIAGSTPWVTFEFDYPHAYVRLHFRRIYDWRGEPRGREGQRLAFFRLDHPVPQPLLPAAVPALRWLSLPALIAEATLDDASVERNLVQLERAFAQGVRMVLLRASAGLEADTIKALTRQVQIRADAVGALVAMSSAIAATVGQDCAEGGGAGVLLEEADLGMLDARHAAGWVGLRTASRPAVQRAARLGYDYVLAGPVMPDPTTSGSEGNAIGWHGFSGLAHHTPLPVYATGGLHASDLQRARLAGAHGLVVPLSWLVAAGKQRI
jgi:8-oxo-dGTP diphosphatase